jgi:hypothetical protein
MAEDMELEEINKRLREIGKLAREIKTVDPALQAVLDFILDCPFVVHARLTESWGAPAPLPEAEKAASKEEAPKVEVPKVEAPKEAAPSKRK